MQIYSILEQLLDVILVTTKKVLLILIKLQKRVKIMYLNIFIYVDIPLEFVSNISNLFQIYQFLSNLMKTMLMLILKGPSVITLQANQIMLLLIYKNISLSNLLIQTFINGQVIFFSIVGLMKMLFEHIHTLIKLKQVSLSFF